MRRGVKTDWLMSDANVGIKGTTEARGSIYWVLTIGQ